VAFSATLAAGAQTLVQPEKRANQHGELEADYADVVRDAGAMRLRLANGHLDDAEAYAGLERLNDRLHELDRRAGRYWDATESNRSESARPRRRG
jgi:hypothetical protein